MKHMLGGIASALSLGMIATSPVWAQTAGSPIDSAGVTSVGKIGDVNIFAGVRLWANEWSMNTVGNVLVGNPSNPSSLLVRQETTSASSEMKFVPMPTIGARYGNFLGSVTYFVPTSYDNDVYNSKSVERSEVDVNLGYYVLPSLVVSLGYKYFSVDRVLNIANSEQKGQGLLLGVSGSAPLSDKLSLYGNFAYGLGQQKSDFKDARGDDQYSDTYAIGEVGLSYRFMEGGPGSFLKAVTGSLGYRTQTVTTKDVGLGTYALNNPTTPVSTYTADMRTTTNGFILAIVGVF